ncbi:MAG: chemotaxis protein CheA, partial [Tetrasphaera sp.]|nr:chemotaxis protein CheA [Tetrasphaera sp.]
QDQELMRSMHRLNLVAGELQEGVMKTRMQPIDNVWSKIPRVVRDLANQMGRQIRVDMEGKDTELDKTILEAIKDPLTHLVRNSCDHGIETPETRIAKGKPAEGRLLMRAFHEGGQVNIEIIDDGAGIDPDKLRDKAVEKQLLSREEADRLSDR